jgi:hypothetical protein
MQWRRIDPVQQVGALLAVGTDAVVQAENRLASKSPLFQQMKQAKGRDWLAYFAIRIPSVDGEYEFALPHIVDMQPLYEETAGWWLPVGTEMAIAETLRPELRRAICKEKKLKPPFILIPRFAPNESIAYAADVYKLV